MKIKPLFVIHPVGGTPPAWVVESTSTGYHLRFSNEEEAKKHVEERMTMTEDDIEALAEQALNQAIFFIHEQRGITSGDAAAQYFYGDSSDAIETILRDYIRLEEAIRKGEPK